MDEILSWDMAAVRPDTLFWKMARIGSQETEEENGTK